MQGALPLREPNCAITFAITQFSSYTLFCLLQLCCPMPPWRLFNLIRGVPCLPHLFMRINALTDSPLCPALSPPPLSSKRLGMMVPSHPEGTYPK